MIMKRIGVHIGKIKKLPSAKGSWQKKIFDTNIIPQNMEGLK